MKQTKRRFTAVISREAGWWVGFILEVSGVNCQAPTRKELMGDLRSALDEALQIRRELALSASPEKYEEETVLFGS